MKIYAASSWRNQGYQGVVEFLEKQGHKVYDFMAANARFHWHTIDYEWQDWTASDCVNALEHPSASAAFGKDLDALDDCEVCVLVNPCGASAHLEAGYAIGQGKPVIIMIDNQKPRPELMYKLAHAVVASLVDLQDKLAQLAKKQQLEGQTV